MAPDPIADGAGHFKARSCYGHRMTRMAMAALGVGLLAGGLPSLGCAGRNINDVPVKRQDVVPFPKLQTYPDIAWLESVSEARARASEDHKPLLVFVRAAWSQASVLMDSTIWHDERILAEAPRFVSVRVDLTDAYGDPMPASLKDFPVDGVPTTLVIAADGHVTGRFTAGTARAADVARAMIDAK